MTTDELKRKEWECRTCGGGLKTGHNYKLMFPSEFPDNVSESVCRPAVAILSAKTSKLCGFWDIDALGLAPYVEEALSQKDVETILALLQKHKLDKEWEDCHDAAGNAITKTGRLRRR